MPGNLSSTDRWSDKESDDARVMKMLVYDRRLTPQELHVPRICCTLQATAAASPHVAVLAEHHAADLPQQAWRSSAFDVAITTQLPDNYAHGASVYTQAYALKRRAAWAQVRLESFIPETTACPLSCSSLPPFLLSCSLTRQTTHLPWLSTE